MPSFLKQLIVERQSAPVRKPVTCVVPLAIEPSITERCETDLSPGTTTVPLRLFAGFITVFIRSFLYGYFIIHISQKPDAFHSVLFRIKGKVKNTAVAFTIVNNSHVFDVNSVAGEENRNNCD